MEKGVSSVLNAMLRQAEEKFTPISVLIEITHRCNFDCVHCYQAHQHRATRPELTAAEWCRVLDEAQALGTFFLTISGGEMLVRRDWFAIAQHARRIGLALRLYTNGALITVDVADQMTTLDPIGVEISVYSHNSTVFDGVTQRRGSFERTLRGIRLVRERNLPLTIKTPIMKQNVDGYRELIALADELGAYYILDPQLTPRNDGSLAPLQYQVDNAQLAGLYSDPALYDQPCSVAGADVDAFMNAAPCGSGRRIMVVDPYGEVYGCLQMLRTNGNVRRQPLADIWWHGASLVESRTKQRKDLVRCDTCPGVPYCQPCMGLSEMEHGQIVGHSTIACRQNHLRYQQAMAARGISVDLPERLGGNRPLSVSAIAGPITLLGREKFRRLKETGATVPARSPRAATAGAAEGRPEAPGNP